MPYLNVLWKWKRLLILATVLPPAAAALVLLALPTKYSLTFTYEKTLTEKDLDMLLGRFRSAENLAAVTGHLRAAGLDHYARAIERANKRQSLDKLLKFQVLPARPERRITTDPATSELIAKLQTELLKVTIVARPEKAVPKIATVIKQNLKSELSLHTIKSELVELSRGFKSKLAQIEQARFDLQLTIDRERATLEKLKSLRTEDWATASKNIILQFNNVPDDSQYLPLGYRLEVVQARVVELQEAITEQQKKYDYYQDVLAVNERLLAQLQQQMSHGWTIEQYHSFLMSLLPEYTSQHLADYLKAYVKNIETVMLSAAPVVENPAVYLIPKGFISKTALVFVASLLAAMFACAAAESVAHSRDNQPPAREDK
jgi:hypothetical protein